MKFLAHFVMQGERQAVVATTVSGVLSLIFLPFALWSAAALGLVTLRVGQQNGLRVVVGSIVAMVVLSYLLLANGWPALVILLLLWLPTWWLAGQLRHHARQSLLLLQLLIPALLLVVALHLLMGGEPTLWWQGVLAQGIAEVRHELMAAQGGALDLNHLEALVVQLAPLMNAAVVVLILLHILGGVLLARWWQAQLFNPGGFGREFQAIRLGRTVSGLALLLLSLALLLQSELLQTLLVVVVLLLVLQGVAVVHALVRQQQAGRGWLIGLYLLLLLALPQMVMVLALAGWVDNWFDFRAFWQVRHSDLE